jgi:hypothetical protein
MAKYHINPETGNVGRCKSVEGKCPFGDEELHYSTDSDARTAYENSAATLEESGQVWPPAGLPKKLNVIASTSDLIRHYNDDIYEGGEGVCLGASAYISYKLIEQEVPHKLVRGEYTDKTGENKAHWWVETSGWIIDASRGQFEEDTYKSGVIRAGHSSYKTLNTFDPGHKSRELVQAELNRCFEDSREAAMYFDEIEGLDEESRSMFSEASESV